jgi:hypothetical protein
MKRLVIRLVALGVVLCLFAGCATTDSGRTKAEGTGYGALLGAGLGAGIGALVGGKQGAAIGAGVGAVVGAGAGYWAGSTVAERKEKYASAEDRLDGETAVVAKYNSDLKEYNEQTATRVNELTQEVADLKEQNQSSKVKLSALNDKKKEIVALNQDGEKRANSMNKELVDLIAYSKSLENTQDKMKVAMLDKEVAALKQNVAMLDSSNKQIALLANSTTVRK